MMTKDQQKAWAYLDGNLQLLTLERTGWRRWIFGRWLYRSEPFRNDIARAIRDTEFLVPKDAKRLEVDNQYRVQWIADCKHWHGKALTGERRHYCPDWDGMPIDETCKEIEGCSCYV